MARVTDKNFYMEDRLKKKLDLMIKRCTGNNKKDTVLLVEGGEGEGKSNLSVQIAYYVHKQTGRPFGVDNIYFNLSPMIEHAKSHKDQIYVWDEPALEGLSTDWFKQVQKDLIKLLMMARKKRHFFIINITKFFKFPEYIVVDRSIGMIHVYSYQELKPGFFVYYNRKSKEYLYNNFRKQRARMYKKYYNFRGRFSWMLPQLIDEKAYEKKKDEAIEQIGKVDNSKNEPSLNDIRFIKMKYYFHKLIMGIPNFTLREAKELINIPLTETAITNWGRYKKRYPDLDWDVW